jgi:hypothetical protein
MKHTTALVLVLLGVLLSILGLARYTNINRRWLLASAIFACLVVISLIASRETFTPDKLSLTEQQVRRWITKIDPTISANCEECIVKGAMNRWDEETLNRLEKMPKEKQEELFHTMRTTNCGKCVDNGINQLDEKLIAGWLSILHGKLDGGCFDCVVREIRKNWKETDFSKIKALTQKEQKVIVEKLLKEECGMCSNHLDEKTVRNWLNTLVSEKADCVKCIENTVLKRWSVDDFLRISKLPKAEQLNFVHALIDVNCDKVCPISHPLTELNIRRWLDPLLPDIPVKERECLSDVIMKLWTPDILRTVQSSEKHDQLTIVKGLLRDNCGCKNELTEENIMRWAKSVYPDFEKECETCLAVEAKKLWTQEQFDEIKTLDLLDQAKIAKRISEYECPHVCQYVV